jgi:uncharacterized protein YbjT (DUF2867 family)
MLSPETLADCFTGMDQAFYLVHSMGASGSFEAKDRVAATNFAAAAARAGVKRTIYLGGLGVTDESLSSHLRSRQEVGEILRASSVPVIEFRASIVIGSGSLSFEMIRTLVERLPVMITPRWVSSHAQPIAISDLLTYLLAALSLEKKGSVIYEIGGSDVVSYGDMMREYAKQRDLRRLFIPVPILSSRLSSLWLGLVTPVYSRIGRKLIDSLKCSTTVRDKAALRDFPIRPMGMKAAIHQALLNEEKEFSESHWADALSSSVNQKHWGGVRFGARLVDHRSVRVPVPPEEAFRPIQRIGGRRGWYFGNWLWKLRGWMDLAVGGVGLKRGRRDPTLLCVGDVLDWWRVEAFEPGRILRLRAEMKLPGRAWLEFQVTKEAEGSRITQTAEFEPHGLWGILYWYGIYPIHQVVFLGMLRKIARLAKRGATNG